MSLTKQYGPQITIDATAVITENRFVTYNGAHTADISCAGIALHSVNSGEPITVQSQGRLPVEASGVINAGDFVASDANGKAVALAVAAVADVVKICGKAVEAAAADGDIILVDLKPL